ncbi:unnamed protein product, partial [Rhizoctonia solani]
MCKIGTPSDIINVMQHAYAAPVFRRTSPDSPESLVNLPSQLTTIDIGAIYARYDILLFMLTHRPTHLLFRYDVNYRSRLSDTSFSTADVPGSRWLYGLEEEIRSTRAIVAAGVDPSLRMERIVVQESWRLAALVYLFMVLCGVDPKDVRVTMVHAKLMKLYTAVEARRIPDSFLILPMLI